MLRIEFHRKGNLATMRIEGRFVGRFAEEARDLAVRKRVSGGLVVDLSEVSFVDATGEAILSWLAEIGSTFVAESAYSSDVCTRLNLPPASQANEAAQAFKLSHAECDRQPEAD